MYDSTPGASYYKQTYWKCTLFILRKHKKAQWVHQPYFLPALPKLLYPAISMFSSAT